MGVLSTTNHKARNTALFEGRADFLGLLVACKIKAGFEQFGALRYARDNAVGMGF